MALATLKPFAPNRVYRYKPYWELFRGFSSAQKMTLAGDPIGSGRFNRFPLIQGHSVGQITVEIPWRHEV